MPHLPKKEMLVVLVKQALFQTNHHRNMAQYWIDNFSSGRKQHHQQRICKKKMIKGILQGGGVQVLDNKKIRKFSGKVRGEQKVSL